MSEILYIQTEKNVEVHNHQVYLQDVAKLACSNQKVLNRNRMRRVLTLPENETGRYVVSAVDLVKAVAREEESVDVTHIGEANFVLSYEKKAEGTDLDKLDENRAGMPAVLLRRSLFYHDF